MLLLGPINPNAIVIKKKHITHYNLRGTFFTIEGKTILLTKYGPVHIS